MIHTHSHARRRPVTLARNPLRLDPTKTGLIRRAFLADVRKRWNKLRRELRRLIVTEDSFGLSIREPGLPRMNQSPVINEPYQFLASDQKLEAFNTWFTQQIDAGVLRVAPGETPWTAKYVESAYKKAAVEAYIRKHKEALLKNPDFAARSQAEFLRSSFDSPTVVSKIRLLGTRAFNNMKGVTDSMGTQMNRVLADAIAQGRNPRTAAREMMRVMDITQRRANAVARTEIIYAHAEGQLDAFEELGVEEVEIMAEWSTAGDDRVCPQCSPLEGSVFTVKEARGMIPRHPNCRCSWIPADAVRKDKGQKRGKTKLQDRLRKSVRSEVGKKGRVRDSGWIGSTRRISKDRSPRA